MAKNQSQIELLLEDGTKQTVNVDLVLNPKKMMFIERDFPEAKDVMSMVISDKGMNLDMIQLFKVVYVAYRMANMNEYVSFDEFQDMYEFDMSEASNVFYSLISKDFRSKYLDKLRKAVKGGNSSKQ